MDTAANTPPLSLSSSVEAIRDVLLVALPHLLADRDRPRQRRNQLAETLHAHLLTRKAALHRLQAAASAGQGTLAATQFEAELARVSFAEGQLVHLDEHALLYTLGVFAVDGRPGDYVTPYAGVPPKAADRD